MHQLLLRLFLCRRFIFAGLMVDSPLYVLDLAPQYRVNAFPIGNLYLNFYLTIMAFSRGCFVSFHYLTAEHNKRNGEIRTSTATRTKTLINFSQVYANEIERHRLTIVQIERKAVLKR